MAILAKQPPKKTAEILCSSALALNEAGAPPTEFRIFKKGWNETTKGNLLFDDAAAKAVLAQYQKEGVDLIVDLNHDSLNKEALAARADASDARGWYQLELREGELWAVNVRWTPDGARRLAEKTQRYISPVALYDAETKRVEYVANVALCAMPATLEAAPLVAASKIHLTADASANEVQNAVSGALRAKYPDPTGCSGGPWVSDLYDTYAVYERDGLMWSISYTYAGGVATLVGEPTQVVKSYAPATLAASKTPVCTTTRRVQRFSKAHTMSPELLKKILDAIAAGDDKSGLLGEIVTAMAGAEGGEPPSGADPLAAAADPQPADPNKPAVAASVSALAKALGCSTDEEAAAVVVQLQKSVKAQADATAAVELETRRTLIAELVKLGVEKVATAWKGDAKDRNPVERLMVEPITEMRARVELHKADGPRLPAEPPLGEKPTIKLSKDEQAFCTKHGLTAEQFEAKRSAAARSRK